jgi:hypothetical protein
LEVIMTKAELATLAQLVDQIEALSAKLVALETKIEALSTKPTPAPRKVWINPHRGEMPTIAEIVAWRKGWAAANPGFTQAQIEAAEAEFKSEWFAARSAA